MLIDYNYSLNPERMSFMSKQKKSPKLLINILLLVAAAIMAFFIGTIIFVQLAILPAF